MTTTRSDLLRSDTETELSVACTKRGDGASVALFGQAANVSQGLISGEVLLKNVGRGPALTVTALDPGRAALLAEVSLVEPLGGGDDEASRIGRVRLPPRQHMEIGSEYALYYQDTLGGCI